MEPKYLYKYRSILPDEDLSLNCHVNALFECYAMLSSRKQFKDPYDSKIELLYPKKKHVVSLQKHCPFDLRKELKLWLSNMSLSQIGHEKIREMYLFFEKMVDQYAIYCLASSGTNIRMWQDYANDHKGFCIEFKAEPIPVRKVQYRSEIGKVNSIELIKEYFNIKIPNMPDGEVGKKIQKLLHIKLSKYKYEGEYRFISKGNLSGTTQDKKFYHKSAVLSVIFGSRMQSAHKQYIIQNCPFPVLFKQAILEEKTARKIPHIILEIYNSNKHLNLANY